MLDLFADWTSATTMRANQLRLHWALFAAAMLRVNPGMGVGRDGTGAGVVRNDAHAAAEGGRRGPGERALDLDVVVDIVLTAESVRAQSGTAEKGATKLDGEGSIGPSRGTRERCAHQVLIHRTGG